MTVHRSQPMTTTPDHVPRSGDGGEAALLDDEATRADAGWPVPREYLVAPTPYPEEITAVGPAIRPHEPRPQAQERAALVVPGAALLGVVVLGVVVLGVVALAAASWPGTRDEQSSSGPRTTVARRMASVPPTRVAAKPRTPAPAPVAAPDVDGMTLGEARAALAGAGLRARVGSLESEKPPGTVLAQSPHAGEDVARGTTVSLVVSGGAAPVAVPDVERLAAADASRALRAAGLRPQIRPVRSTEAPGTVLAQVPAAGVDVRRGGTIRLQVARAARAPVAIRAPRLVGLSVTEAKDRLRQLDLRWRVVETASSRPAGTVVSQWPGARAALSGGATVSLGVSSGPAPVSVPDVTGLDEATAQQALEAEGFAVVVVDAPTSDPDAGGVVVDQSPGGGVGAEEGASITLIVARLDPGG